jgi:hypothetical protein
LSVILASWEVEIGELRSESGPGISLRPCMRNNLKQNDWGCGLSSGVPA